MFSRREYQRHILNELCWLITKDGRTELLKLIDLSARGAGIVGNYPFEEGEKVTIILNAPLFFEKPLRKQAKVVGSQKIGNNLWRGCLDFGLDNKIELSYQGR